jgi:hypothetical protein
MAVNTQPITDAADDLANALTEGAGAVDALAQGIVDALNALDERLASVEEGGGDGGITEPPPIEPPPEGETGTIPLTWDDQSFSDNSNSNSVTVAKGATVANKSITDTGHTASIISQGGTIDTCRVNSREGVRVASGGTHTIVDSYLEAKGTGDDHADTIQAYAPGSRGTIAVSNTSIVAHTTAATAGLFVADDWTGTIELTDVVFQGGPFGLRVHPDYGGDNILKLRNVFFVEPFGYHPYEFGNYGGHRNIFEVWENVRYATIVNGKLVPGNEIPKPKDAAVQAESMTKERAVKEMKTKPVKPERGK